MSWLRYLVDPIQSVLMVWWCAGLVLFANSTAARYGDGLPDRMVLASKLIFREVKPFVLYLVVAQAAAMALDGDIRGAEVQLFAINLINWFAWTRAGFDDDDDLWRRRRARWREKVTVELGRLAVVPA